MANRWGNSGWLYLFIYLAPKSLQMVIAAMKLKDVYSLLLGRKVMTNLDSILKSRGITLSTKVHLVKASSHVWMWQLDYKESWMLKNWCFCIVVLEKTLESPLDCKGIYPVHPKRNQSWAFIGRTDVEAETPIFWTPDVKSWLIWKDLDVEERLKAGGEGDNRGWDGWMASPTHWTWVWVNSGSWWLTGRPGALQFMGLQRVGHDWVTELNWTLKFRILSYNGQKS